LRHFCECFERLSASSLLGEKETMNPLTIAVIVELEIQLAPDGGETVLPLT
jgi:hypothetical protein